MKSVSDRFYISGTLLLQLILPVLYVSASLVVDRQVNVWQVTGEWFLFWAVGVRFVTAGINQMARPGFTLQSIFQISSTEGSVVVRELGFSNFAVGLAAVISLFLPSWRVAVAFVAAVFLGIAATQHAIKGSASKKEAVALLTDALVFLVMAAFVAVSFV